MQYQIKDFYGRELSVQPRLELYSVQDFMGNEMPGLAIVLEDVTDESEPEEYCMLTVSFGEFIGMKNCAYIDSNNCDFTAQLLEQGMAKPTGFTKHSGFCEYPLWEFDEEFLKDMGAVSVRACATHPVFSGPAYEKIANSALEEIIVSDTIPLSSDPAKDKSKITVLTMTKMFADIIRKVYNYEEISSSFIN